MRSVNVNLLPKATKFQLARIRLTKQLNKIAFVLVVIWIIFTSAILLTKLFLSRQKNNLISQKKSLETSLSQFSPQTELQQELRFRLKLAAEVLKTRPPLEEEASKVLSLFPDGVKIKFLRFKGGKIEVGGSIFSLADLVDFEERLGLAKKEERYKTAKLSSLSRLDDYWGFVLELGLNKEK